MPGEQDERLLQGGAQEVQERAIPATKVEHVCLHVYGWYVVADALCDLQPVHTAIVPTAHLDGLYHAQLQSSRNAREQCRDRGAHLFEG